MPSKKTPVEIVSFYLSKNENKRFWYESMCPIRMKNIFIRYKDHPTISPMMKDKIDLIISTL